MCSLINRYTQAWEPQSQKRSMVYARQGKVSVPEGDGVSKGWSCDRLHRGGMKF